VNSSDIRKAFLDFFVEKKHKIIPSSSLIPHGDPTLLLTTAGMVQVKPYFLGLAVPPNQRLVSCQKCFRTTDIESVGDTKHLTFFEMLGNFSVGDYFKKEAIHWGWEFVTSSLKLPKEKLWVTVFLDDDEAYDIWKDIGIPTQRIVRLGEKENFWGPAGDSGPCGPCSEIHYDFGENTGCGNSKCDPSCSCSRFSEIWNLVFMQFNQDSDGNRTPLPKPNIDTGMGLERIVAVCNSTPTVYETDAFAPLIHKISSIVSIDLGKDAASDRALRVIAEHSRGITFLIADGLLPSNEGRGYVLRRIIRRACFLGRKLGQHKPFLGTMAQVIIDKMGDVYPELPTNRKLIIDVIRNEEERFNDTLDAGINLCEKAIADAKTEGKSCLDSVDVFRFWDTYGFPFELSMEIAQEKGIEVDKKGFEAEMEKQRERTRSVQKFSASGETDFLTRLGPLLEKTEFVGYDELATKSKIVQIIDEVSGSIVESATEGKQVALVLDRTPFYGEMGGQVGDKGRLAGRSGEVGINNSISHTHGGIVIIGNVIKGTISKGDAVEAAVDEERRNDIARNHTATHLLQAVMRQVLGSHVSQRGSLVSPERLRFDFTHLSTISTAELEQIQCGVNAIIRRNLPVYTEICAYDKALNEGAMAIFEEKYGDEVRLVKVGDPRVSAELCGGTHIKSTGEIGMFIITSEASVGTGLRRIEAVTGRGAEELVREKFSVIDQLSTSLKSTYQELPARTAQMAANINAGNKAIAALQRELLKYETDRLLKDNTAMVQDIKVLFSFVQSMPATVLMEMADDLKTKMRSGVVVLASAYENKPFIIATATQDIISRGIHSGKLVKKVAEFAGGSGGGKPDMAQAGVRNSDMLGEALQKVPALVEELLKAGHA
jgi:alanyl-tRNA synthetase